ncbi:hypothetical protein TWF703_010297 [Orbilia oligospora]|uniref:Anaphase-promoting complex subunit 4 WD40 domain-containing protein n=1 Tax=Orbilia oligospora TaxID=2813651 RepID=A0A7C8JIT7_ORBOL|nr:hypothetical protein TWF703_010297 [Orbilia oligospora]
MLRNTGCDSEEKLIRILESHTRISGVSEIEKTYITVLDQLLVGLSDWEQKDMINEFQKIIGTIINLATPLSTASLANLLGTPKKKVDSRLDFFHSVLSVPEDPKEPVRLLHLSFRDLLVRPHLKQRRDGSPFRVDEIECHKAIATACLKRLFDTLRKDICGLEDLGELRSTISQEDIENNLRPDLQYACCYWIHHMKLGKASVNSGDQAHEFLKIRFLHWLEALSILGKSYDIILLIRDLTSLIDSSSTEVLEFIRDAHRFTLINRAVIDSTPLQLYSSALIFAPRNSIIRRIFIDQVPDYIQTLPTVEDEWDPVLQILYHEHPAAGKDFSIMLYDSFTGALVRTLRGHRADIEVVAFSPDGELLVSGSRYKTVRVWDSVTGALKLALEGHESDIKAVSFSPDGGLIFSIASDALMQWDSKTGAQCGVLKGSFTVGSHMIFSPDGQLFVSVPDRYQPWIWNFGLGSHCMPLAATKLHRGSGYPSVCLSQDGEMIAIGNGHSSAELDEEYCGFLEFQIVDHSIGSSSEQPDPKKDHDICPKSSLKYKENCLGLRYGAISGNDIGFAFNGKRERAEAKAAISPSNTLLAIAEPHLLYIYNLVSGVQQSVCNGKLAISATDNGLVELWDVSTGVLLQSFWLNVKASAPTNDRPLFLRFSVAFSSIYSWIQGYTFGAIIAYQYENYEGGYFGAISDCKTKMELVSFLNCTKKSILRSTRLSDDDYMLKFSPDNNYKLLAAKINDCLDVWDMLGLIDQTAHDLGPTYMDDKNTETIVSFPDGLQLARPPRKLTGGGRTVRGLGRVSKPSNANSQLTSSPLVLKCSLKPKPGPRSDQLRRSNHILGAKNAEINRDIKRAMGTRLSNNNNNNNNNSLGSKQANSMPNKSVPIDKTVTSSILGSLSWVITPMTSLSTSSEHPTTPDQQQTDSREPTRNIKTVAFSPDGELIALASMVSSIEIWNFRKRELIPRWPKALEWPGISTSSLYAINLAFSPDGNLLLAYGHGVTIWLICSGGLLNSSWSRGNNISLYDTEVAALSPDNKLLATSCQWPGESITLWSRWFTVENRRPHMEHRTPH